MGEVLEFEKTKGLPAAPDPDGGVAPSKALDASPDAIGAWLLDRYADRIAIVGAGLGGETGWHARRSMWGEPCAFVLDEESGRWCREPEKWRTLLQTTLREVHTYIRTDWPADYITPALRTLNTAKRDKKLVDGVRLQLKAVVEDRRKLDPKAWPDVTMCTVDALDKQMRYLGAKNGLIDLKTGSLLGPEEGKTKLVTYSVGIPYDPDAKDDLVDMLLDHLGDQREWWLAVLGHAAWGQPGRRFYFVHGPSGAGKTTMLEAIIAAFGEYASRPPDNVLQLSKMPQQSAATPGLDKLAHPYRIAMFDDMSGGVSPTLLKQVCGGGSITFRRTYEEPQTRRATATPFLVCNPGDEPALAAADPAIRARLRVLDYPPVTGEPIGDLPEKIRTEEFRMALLATIVRAAAQVKPGTPPADIPSVEQATSTIVTQDIGPIGPFAKRLQPGSGNLAFSEVWKAWCKLIGEPAEVRTAGGIAKRSFAKRLRALDPRLHPPKGVRVNGRIVHGWLGWELLDASEVPEDLPGTVEPLPENATAQEAAAANARVTKEASQIRAEIRKKFRWPDGWIEGPGAAVGERVVLAEDGKSLRRVEPQWWPHANVKRGVHLEARYLQPLVLKWKNGTLKATETSPGPIGLRRRIEGFLRWCSYGADMLEAIDTLAIAGGVHVHPALRAGPASDREADEVPAWTSQLVDVLGSQNHGPEKCFERVKALAQQIFPPPGNWAVYDSTTPPADTQQVPETERDSHPLPEIDLVDGEPHLGLAPAKPLAVGSSPGEALRRAAELRDAQDREETLYWVLAGGD